MKIMFDNMMFDNNVSNVIMFDNYVFYGWVGEGVSTVCFLR